MIEQLFKEVETKLKELFNRVAQLEGATNEGTGSGAAPSDAEYLVNAANGDLTNEIVVTAVRGSLIYGDNTPTWTTLAHPAAASHILTTDANDVLWSSGTLNLNGKAIVFNDAFTFTSATDPLTVTFPITVAQINVITTTSDAETNPSTILAGDANGAIRLARLGVGVAAIAADGTIGLLDAGYIGNGAASARLGFDSSGGTNYAYFLGANVGIGTATPTYSLDVESADDTLASFVSTTDKATVRIIDDDSTAYLAAQNGRLTIGGQNGISALNVNIDLSTGFMGLGKTSPSAHMYIAVSGAAVIGQIIEAAAAQTANLFEVNSNGGSGGDLVVVDASGNVGIGATTPSATLHVDQSSTTAAIPVLYLDQADISEEMIEFNTTIGVGNAIEAVGAKTLTTTHFIKVTLPGALTRYIPCGTIA